MPRGPWYISARAVRDYLAVLGRPPVDEGDEWDTAEDELIELAEETVASGRVPHRQRNGMLRYRGPGPERLALIVSETPDQAGGLPALVAVEPPHGRIGDRPLDVAAMRRRENERRRLKRQARKEEGG